MASNPSLSFSPARGRIDSLALLGLDMHMEMACFAISDGCPFTGISHPKYQLSPKFKGDFVKVNGRFKFFYQLSDTENSLYLTVIGLKGKRYKQSRLSPSQGTLIFKQHEVPGSLFFIQIKSCNANGCRNVLNRIAVGKVF